MIMNLSIKSINTVLLICLILNPHIGEAQNPNFNQDMIKISPGMGLEYDIEYFNEAYNIDDEIPDFDITTDNETRTIIEIDYLTGFLSIIQLWCPAVEHCSFEYNSTMDTFGGIAIYVNWDYWETNISQSDVFFSTGLDPEVPFDIEIIDSDKEFGFEITQSGVIDTFGRISLHHKERKIVYSKAYGVKTEELILNIETGPNGWTEHNSRSYVLTTNLGVTSQLDTQGLFKIIAIIMIVIILIFLLIKFRKSRQD